MLAEAQSVLCNKSTKSVLHSLFPQIIKGILFLERSKYNLSQF